MRRSDHAAGCERVEARTPEDEAPWLHPASVRPRPVPTASPGRQRSLARRIQMTPTTGTISPNRVKKRKPKFIARRLPSSVPALSLTRRPQSRPAGSVPVWRGAFCGGAWPAEIHGAYGRGMQKTSCQRPHRRCRSGRWPERSHGFDECPGPGSIGAGGQGRQRARWLTGRVSAR